MPEKAKRTLTYIQAIAVAVGLALAVSAHVREHYHEEDNKKRGAKTATAFEKNSLLIELTSKDVRHNTEFIKHALTEINYLRRLHASTPHGYRIPRVPERRSQPQPRVNLPPIRKQQK